MRRLYVRNFNKYQHYRNRRQPWVKLYRTFWDDPDLSVLPASTRLIALGLVTLAAESEPEEKGPSRRVEGTEKHLSRRLAVNENEMSIAITSLLKCGFLASSPLAGRKQLASPDLEVEKERPKAFSEASYESNGLVSDLIEQATPEDIPF